MSLCLCLVVFLSFFSKASTLFDDLETLTTRAVLITDISVNSLDIGVFGGNGPSLRLYPEFTFTDNVNDNVHAQLMYASDNSLRRSFECTSLDFIIGAWRAVSNEGSSVVTYRKIADFVLQKCSRAILFGCCEFNIPNGLEKGDILGILHGARSSLLHNLLANLTLQELSGVENNVFVPLAGVDLGYPLLTIEPNIISGLISFKLMDDLFRELIPYSHPFEIAAPFTCSGTIESWLIAGTVVTTDGIALGLRLWRRDANNTPFLVSQVIVELSDIHHTSNPNVYRINSPASQFAFRENDYVEIDNGNNRLINQFNISYSIDEIPEEVRIQNANIIPDGDGLVPIFPLLSLVVSGSDCNGNIFYDPDLLSNRAQLLENIDPLPLQPTASLSAGHLYMFPNMTFTEEGSISLWQFAAGINSHVISETKLQYPSLQVWRKTGQNFSLVAGTNNSTAPSLELGALNVYSYECNLTYQAGDFIGVYQPPFVNSRYLLVVADTSGHLSPTVAYQMEVFNTASPLTSISPSDRFLTPFPVEPVINMRSSSMPGGEMVSAQAIPPTQRTEVPIPNPLIVPIGVVGGLLVLLLFSLMAIGLVFCILQCQHLSNKKLPATIEDRSYDYPAIDGPETQQRQQRDAQTGQLTLAERRCFIIQSNPAYRIDNQDMQNVAEFSTHIYASIENEMG